MSEHGGSKAERWAQFRFSVIGALLAAPPPRGALAEELRALAATTWRHPISGAPLRFGRSTIERWLSQARRAERDPVALLRRKPRRDRGAQPSLAAPLRELLRAQHRAHPSWSAKLHADNLVALAAEHALAAVPSTSTVRRYLRAQGLERTPRARSPRAPGLRAREPREIRSFELPHVHALWHADFHHGSLELYEGRRPYRPKLLGFLDDHSRLVCHLQWVRDETAESFVHGLMQAIQKRALPRALMTDQGAPMLAEEVVQGLARLGILHQPTLPYSPYQNAKQEVFWARVEGRLMALLEGVAPLTLELLNRATLAWVEREYHLELHRELGTSPLERFATAQNLGRESPGPEDLRSAFRLQDERRVRRSDGTIVLLGLRFEIPSRFRHLHRVTVRYARWDLAHVELVDPQTDVLLATLAPLDKARNADARRRRHAPLAAPHPTAPPDPPKDMPALLRKLLAEIAASGAPPGYLPLRRRDAHADLDPDPTPTPDPETEHG